MALSAFFDALYISPHSIPGQCLLWSKQIIHTSINHSIKISYLKSAVSNFKKKTKKLLSKILIKIPKSAIPKKFNFVISPVTSVQINNNNVHFFLQISI